MADVAQYEFSLAEVAQVLIKKAGVTEGRWMIGVNFAIGVASAGPDKDHVRPTALVSVDQLILTKTTETGPLTFDAAEASSNDKR
jgi:hypothetical protein